MKYEVGTEDPLSNTATWSWPVAGINIAATMRLPSAEIMARELPLVGVGNVHVKRGVGDEDSYALTTMLRGPFVEIGIWRQETNEPVASAP